MDIVNFATAFGTQRRDHQRRTAPQIGGTYLCAAEPVCAAYGGAALGKANLRPHLPQLRYVAIAVFKHRLDEYRLAPCAQKRRHQQGLGIGGKARIGRGTHRIHSAQMPVGGEGNAVGCGTDGAAGLLQRRQHGGEMAVIDIPYGDLPAC